jgi:GntR family transcriptional regulator
MTARKAVDQLEQEGYVERIARKGAFVKAKKYVIGGKISGFSEALRKQGHKEVYAIELEKEVTVADASLARKLKVKKGAPVYILTRLRIADGAPLALEISHIPLDRFPGINKIDFSTHSLFDTMFEDYKRRSTTAERHVSVSFTDEFVAKHMKLPVNYPVFFLRSIGYDEEHLPIEFLISYNSIEHTSFYYELKRENTIDYTFDSPNEK